VGFREWRAPVEKQFTAALLKSNLRLHLKGLGETFWR